MLVPRALNQFVFFHRMINSKGTFIQHLFVYALPCAFEISHLFLQRFLPSGGDLGCRRALTGASFQQVNPGWSRALLIFKVEQHILVKSEELLVPPAVLRRLLTQIAALSSLFTRDHREKQRVPFVVADALLHFIVGMGRKFE